MNILTNDPSFTAWGWAVIDKDNKIIDCGCIKTAPEQKKRRIRASDDRERRSIEITTKLIKLIQKYDISFIISESPHGSQNARAAIMIGIVTGIITAISCCMEIPIETYSEQDAKKVLLGKKAATKDDIIEAIDRLYDVEWTDIKYIDESVADAMAIYNVALQQSSMLKILRK